MTHHQGRVIILSICAEEFELKVTFKDCNENRQSGDMLYLIQVQDSIWQHALN